LAAHNQPTFADVSARFVVGALIAELSTAIKKSEYVNTRNERKK
jgi:hypothetical protein